MKRLQPLELVRLPGAFDDPDFLFEVKFDGFRALAYVERGRCELVSRRGHRYKRFEELCQGIAADLPHAEAVLDGEIVCLDARGHSRFNDLLFRRERPYFYAFDLLWLDGVDLRGRTLVARKAALRREIPRAPSRLLYLDHIEDEGIRLFQRARQLDLEGIVAKPKRSPYRVLDGRTPWLKIKNPDYTQALGRAELFRTRR